MKQKEQPPLGSKKRNQNFISMITKPSSLTEMKIKKIFNSSISTQSGLNTSNCYAKKMKNRNETKTKILKSSSVQYMQTNQPKEIIKAQNELFELQLINSRFENDNRIKSEKIKSLEEIIKMKETENDLLTTKYNDYINEFQSEIAYLSKVNNDNKKYKVQYDNMKTSFKNFIQITIEIFEIFISNKNNNHITHRSTLSNKNETSFDIYDSFTNLCDDERKNTLISQIQSLFIAKLKSLEHLYSLNIDKEIEKIQTWNYNTNNNSSNNITNTISNISNILKNNLNNEISNSNENDFDLSMSKTFFHQSPRFSSFMKKEKNNISYGSFCDNVTNIIIPKSQSNNTSIMKNININITSNFNSNNTMKSPGNNNINILDCSFGDFVKKGDESFGAD